MRSTAIDASGSEIALSPDTGADTPTGWVEVAIDAAGPAGGQTFTYHLPAQLADLSAGEAVLVDYGRRQAVGVVLGRHARAPERETKPVLARVRSDGPLLPPLQLQLVSLIAGRYYAPPALVVRQMLPAGYLERVELIARSLVEPSEAEAEAREEAGAGSGLLNEVTRAGPEGMALDDLPREGSRAALLRELHSLAARGRLELNWRLRPPGASERIERRARLTSVGHEVARALAAGEEPGGAGTSRPLGPRQKALLLELYRAAAPLATARLAERHSSSALPGLVRRGLLEVETERIARRPLAGRAAPARGTRPPQAPLSADQAAALERIVAAVHARSAQGFLLEGQPASGKSTVYAGAVAAALAAGRDALVLVPEIALAVPLLDRLRHDLDLEPALLHSSLSDGERADEWRRIRAGEVRLVVGTRLALLAPLADPGVIIVDEEHDPAYKSDRTPRFQARELALELGRLAGAPVVLGSATPDVITVGRVELGDLEHLRLPDRQVGRRAEVQLVDLRQELADGNRGLLSRALVEALGSLDREAGDQAILLINRRGSASVVICRDCGYVQICPECQRPLVFHASTLALRCHHCGAGAPPARTCPACDSVRIRYLGGGTQRVEREVVLRFPELRVVRLDRDVVARRGAAARVIDEFSAHAADVLVGTALVAKGLDVPQVTLVGVVSADIALNLPDERAAERTYQLLAQAVGRAGRGERPGRAIIQTYQPEHPAIEAVARHDAQSFYRRELDQRRRFRSPPFGELIKLTVALEDRTAAERQAEDFATELRARAAQLGRPVEVLGPVPAYIARRAGRWRFQLVLRGDGPREVLGTDPGAPWSVDADPESLL